MEREEAYAIIEYALGVYDNAGKHEREWWKTYRAALTGIVMRVDSTSIAHELAAKLAVAAHGPLITEPKP